MNRHPDKLSVDDISTALAKREKRLARNRAEEARITAMMFEGINDK